VRHVERERSTEWINVCPDSGARGLSLRVWLAVLGLLAGAALLPAAALAQTAAGGATHTIILKSDGTVWTVGGNCPTYRNVCRLLT